MSKVANTGMRLRRDIMGRWFFQFGEQITRMGDGPMFFQDRAAAERAATERGLQVYGRHRWVRVDPRVCAHSPDGIVTTELTTATGPVHFDTCDSCKTTLRTY